MSWCTLWRLANAGGWRWAQVTYISDGDTLWVRSAPDRAPQKLRLAAMDAPELCQFWGPQARNALRTLLPQGQWVRVQSVATDAYGRQVAEVWRDEINVSAWMVARGHAWASGRNNHLLALQLQAQQLGLGLFGAPALRPQDHRRWYGSCQGV